MNGKINTVVICILLMFSSYTFAQQRHQKGIPIKVVVVTTFEIGNDTGDAAGEFQNWVEKFPLPTILPFPQGYHHLRYNPEKQVLGIVTGEGPSRIASSITALANDKRFDLSHAYWILAGIAGVDPHYGSLASVAWARYVVDGDLGYEIDSREIPSGWDTGYVPYGRTTPYQAPRPPISTSNGANAFILNAGLADWAFRLSSARVKLVDNDNLQHLRAKYEGFPKAQQPPFILEGDVLAAATFWIGDRLNTWAENWVKYWSDGQATFVMSAEEDSGYLQALTFLSQANMVDLNRVMVLRSASDYTVPAPGETAAQVLAADEDHNAPSAIPESMSTAFEVGSAVVNELVSNWSSYRDHIPGK
jgi:purine nucleoside permease